VTENAERSSNPLRRGRAPSRTDNGGCGANEQVRGALTCADPNPGLKNMQMHSAPKEPSCQPRTKTPATIRWTHHSPVDR
jgi:hypothetical protein